MVLNNLKKAFIILSLTLISSVSMFAIEVPALTSRVMDKAKVINSRDEAEITEYLKDLEDTTGIQIAVLTVQNLGGESIESFGIKCADKWKLGSEKEDNGAILLVAMDEHSVRIEVGDGLEGLLTDAKCGLIIRNVIIPEFKNGNYSDGISKGVKNMVGIASENAELVSKKVSNNEEENSSSLVITLLVWIIFIAWTIIAAKLNRRRNFGRNITGPVIYHSFGPHTTTHNFGGGHSSGFGGGFSGGGGHFSGGGASGHW